MTRLIDADELALKLRHMGYMDEHEEVQEVIDEAPTIYVVGVGRYEKAMQKLRELPRCLNGVKEKQIKTISADEVVRCKDCIDWDKDGFCGITGREEPESHYCSYGERKDESEVKE